MSEVNAKRSLAGNTGVLQCLHDMIGSNRMNALTQREALALSEQSAHKLNNIIERDAKAAADVRSRAAASILAGMKKSNASNFGRSGQELLQQVRYGRHGI